MLMHCERCQRQMRQVLTWGVGGYRDSWVQDWCAAPGQPTVRVAETDDDICEDCETEVFEAIEAHEAQAERGAA